MVLHCRMVRHGECRIRRRSSARLASVSVRPRIGSLSGHSATVSPRSRRSPDARSHPHFRCKQKHLAICPIDPCASVKPEQNMASLRQIESARRNGAKSKGPITDEGKARSSRNATKHGFAAGHHILVINEREDLYELMLAEYMQRFQPADRVEADLVHRIVAAQWKMQRIDTGEAAMLDLQMDRDRPAIEKEFNHIDEGTRLGIAF